MHSACRRFRVGYAHTRRAAVRPRSKLTISLSLPRLPASIRSRSTLYSTSSRVLHNKQHNELTQRKSNPRASVDKKDVKSWDTNTTSNKEIYKTLLNAAESDNMALIAETLKRVADSRQPFSPEYLTPILIACRKHNDLKTAMKLWNTVAKIGHSASNYYHMIALFLQQNRVRDALAWTCKAINNCTDSSVLLQCIDLFTSRHPRKALALLEYAHSRYKELKISETGGILLKIYSAIGDTPNFLATWKSLEVHNELTPGSISPSEWTELRLTHYIGHITLETDAVSKLTEEYEKIVRMFSLQGHEIESLNPTISQILKCDNDKFMEIVRALVDHKQFECAKRIIDAFMSEQSATQDFSKLYHDKNVTVLSALLYYYARRPQYDMNTVKLIFQALERITNPTVQNYTDLLTARHLRDMPEAGIHLGMELMDNGVPISAELCTRLILLLTMRLSLGVEAHFAQISNRLDWLEAMDKQYGEAYMGVMRFYWKYPSYRDFATLYQRALASIVKPTTTFSSTESLIDTLRELISRELYSTAVTIVSNQYSSNSTLVDRNVLNLGMRAALEMIKRTQKKKVARAYRTWIRQAFNKLILVAEDHLRGHARLQALETATIHNLPRNVIQALCSPLLLPCRKSHKHKHVANAVEATKTHSSESRIAPFSSKIIPDSQSFQLRFQACTNAQEAKAIYHLLKRYKNSTNFPGDIKLDLETCKTIIRVCKQLGSFGGALQVYDDYIATESPPDAELYELLGSTALKYPEPEDRSISNLVAESLQRLCKEARHFNIELPNTLIRACVQYAVHPE